MSSQRTSPSQPISMDRNFLQLIVYPTPVYLHLLPEVLHPISFSFLQAVLWVSTSQLLFLSVTSYPHMLVFSPPSLGGWAKSGKTEFYLSSTLGGVHRRLVAQLVEAAVWEWLAWATNFGLGSSRYEDERFDFSARSELPVAEPVARSIWSLNCTATWIWFWLAYALPSTWTATHVIQHAINRVVFSTLLGN